VSDDHHNSFKPPIQPRRKQSQESRNSGSSITDRGRPAHVLLTFAAYKKITASHAKIADLLAMPSGEDFEFDAPPLRDLARPADFS
jgi:hypothetical protein